MTNEKNITLIKRFYAAFAATDAKKMTDCYHKNIEFKDPAFGKLDSKQATEMWEMLCQNASDLDISLKNCQANETSGTAEWHATYTFSKTGRPVTNIVFAKFEFQDGKIRKHTDTFNLRRWAGQAMGIKGKLLGGTRFFRERLQEQTNLMLKKYMEIKAQKK